jgi:hypothetical protein
MLTPFRIPGNDPKKKYYNTSFSGTRVLIENAFGLLKARWGQLKYLKFFTIEKTALFVKACCVLHNICIDKQDHWDDEDIDVANPDDSDSDENCNDNRNGNNTCSDGTRGSNALLKRQGETKRITIMNDLYNSRNR